MWLNTRKVEDEVKYKKDRAETRRMVNTEKNKVWNKTCQDLEMYIRSKSTQAWRFIKNVRCDKKDAAQLQYISIKQWKKYYMELLLENRAKYIDPPQDNSQIEGESITLEVKKS
jgi:hypothetical protein